MEIDQEPEQQLVEARALAYSIVYNRGWGKILHADDVEGAANMAVAKARAFYDVERGAALNTYVTAVLKNDLLNMVADTMYHRLASLDEEITKELTREPDPVLRLTVEEAALGFGDREFELFYRLGLGQSASDIARTWGVSRETVSKLRQQLKEKL
jgi:RNA polymerase sigma factor (sigma-70 family)